MGGDFVTAPAAPAVEPREAARLVGRVVVALSGAEPIEGAIALGRVIAGALDAPLHGLLAWPRALAPADVARMLGLEAEALVGMVLDVEVGDPAERVAAMVRSHPAALVVLSAPEDAPDTCGLGEHGARVLAGASSGAIVVRPGMRVGDIRRILIPLDGTPSAARAFEPAGALAKRAGAALDVVLIADVDAPLPVEPGAMTSPRYVDQPQHEWPAFTDEFLRRFVGAIGHCPAGVPTRFFLGAGSPAPEILRFASELDSDLIALAWHGRCEGACGGVVRDVLRGARRPVLVLRH
jgi:nucleotide-binding universal stress UspA family protein